MKIKKIDKHFSKWEEKRSFKVVAPVTGYLISLRYSNDNSLCDGQLGLGFVLENFKENFICSPIGGYISDIYDFGASFVIYNEFHQIFCLVRITGDNESIHFQGLQSLVRYGFKVIPGMKLLKIDRKYLESKNYDFQVTVTFYRDQKHSEALGNKYDILYDYERGLDYEIDQRGLIGHVYFVSKKRSLDFRHE